MFSQLGFKSVTVTGHKDKHLEYGLDMWMKFQIPTKHFLYFGVQAKRNKLDSTANSKNENIAQVLNQILMMLENPVRDPETNTRQLLDHVFIVSAGEITKQAKKWLEDILNKESRRHVMFLDRDQLLDILVGVKLPVLEKY